MPGFADAKQRRLLLRTGNRNAKTFVFVGLAAERSSSSLDSP
jgi:hypothetical protein